MTNWSPLVPSLLKIKLIAAGVGVALICSLPWTAPPARAQSFSVLHNFTGGQDGARPYGGVVLDDAGNIYGTTVAGGLTYTPCGGGCGTVFQLRPVGPAWVLNRIYGFHHDEGWQPLARVVFGPDGALYGTTLAGGTYGDYGTVFRLQQPSQPCKTAICPWNQTVLWNFGGGDDGINPGVGDLTFDAEGRIYGTTYTGGARSLGTVYQLTPIPGGGWTESVVYSFQGGLSGDGALPWANVTFDPAGNMYTTTMEGGGADCGTAVRLYPSQSGWADTILHSFACSSDGQYPLAGLVFDPAGNLYGATVERGPSQSGTVFELAAPDGSGGYSIIYNFNGIGYGPSNSLTLGSDGGLYGTAQGDGQYGQGTVFKLTYANGTWTYTSLHDFTGRDDGGTPFSRVAFDADGNLYGTASMGGSFGYGVVWKITP